MPELALFLVRLGLLTLLWLFVLAAVQVVRTDLSGSRPLPMRSGQAVRRPGARREVKESRSQRRQQRQPRTLVVTAGALTGTSLTLAHTPITIGRADDSTLVLDDDYASARHARLVPGQREWLVEDLGSTNGTYLDRVKVTAPTPVPMGAPIRIGKTTLELRR